MTTLDRLSTRNRHGRHHDLGRAQHRGPSSSGKLTFSLPDLRFEQSYLLSLQRFIHQDDAQGCLTTNRDEKLTSGARKGGKLTKDRTIEAVAKTSGTEAGFYGVPMRMNWGGIIYVTILNQILSPFAQGAALAILTVYLRPFLRTLGARVRTHVVRTHVVRTHVVRSWLSIFPPIEQHIQGSTGWMRKQLREFSVGGVGANIALGK